MASTPIPNSFDSTASIRWLWSNFSLSIISSAFSSRCRAAIRSTGISLDPSGTQILLIAGEPRACPICAAISRVRRPCSIQNSRIPVSGCESVKLSSAFGWAKNVGLKSSLMSLSFAQSTQGNTEKKSI